ncbi:MAG: heme exporter protein CcmD [Micropepsaceae bacterium]
MSTFWAMGGYAAFVWPAYGISFIALVTLSVLSWRAMKRAERLAELSAREDKP